jgi:hypothetical protein
MGRLLLQPRAPHKVCGDRRARCLERDMRSVDGAQRSLIFICVGLEQGLISCICRPFAPRASSDQVDAFIAKGGLLIVFYRPGWTAGGALNI